MLASRYNLVKKLSSGSTASVLLAVDVVTKQEVVIKRMRTLGREKRIEEEIRINQLVSGQGQGFSRMHNHFETSEETFVIFDRVTGVDLFEMMEARKFRPLPEGMVHLIMKMAARAIHKCHQKNVAHRDIKLENLMVDFENDEVTLIDFGLSCTFDRKNGAEMPVKDFCGSVEYLAPEALVGRSFRATKADSWALGVTAYALIFGEFPYDVEDIIQGMGHPYASHVKSVPLPEDVHISDMMRKKLSALLCIDPQQRADVSIFV